MGGGDGGSALRPDEAGHSMQGCARRRDFLTRRRHGGVGLTP